MKKCLVPLLVIGICSLVIAAPAAAVPQYLNYQGVLRDSAGNLVTGNKQMTFKIYDAETGGTELFSMTSPEVAVNNGLYTVQIGPLSSTELASGRRWLQVTVGSDTLSPRLEILAVAYAITAASAESAARLGTYSPAASGANIIPVTDSSGKLDAAVIPSSGTVSYAAYADYAAVAGTATTAASATTATNADYATLSGTATNAGTVDNLSASSTATANQLLALDANTQFKGMSVSAEASTSNYALYVNGGKIGIKTGTNMSAGTGTITSGGAEVTISNAPLTANSIILLTVGYGGSPATNNGTDRALKISDVNAGSGQFKVRTMDGSDPNPNNIPFSYLIIN